jgi:diaminohydroxyphosphoribosylaminopyrimidine deaminase / 5-amino-6-(5-phosphoribosylamino)uracil reductase
MATTIAPAMMSHEHKRWMHVALQESTLCTVEVEPNPPVGCVIVAHDQCVGKGHTQAYGGDHAEVQALQQAQERAIGATVYVTLEPCPTTGNTPPCTDALIRAGVARVVIGCTDPHPAVQGKGIDALRSAGIEVVSNVLQQECEQRIIRFEHFLKHRRSWLTVKIAQTLDGYVATQTRRSQWISSEQSRVHAHHQRTMHRGIMVGVGTVISDNPALTVRHVHGYQPHRIVIDAKLRTPLDSYIVQSANDIPTTLVCLESAAVSATATSLSNAGVLLTVVQPTAEAPHRVHLAQTLAALYADGITSILCEGGAGVAAALIRATLVNELLVYTAPSLFGSGVRWTEMASDDPSDAQKFRLLEMQSIENDVVTRYMYNG